MTSFCSPCGEEFSTKEAVLMPITPLDEEFGQEESENYMHLNCAKEELNYYKCLVKKMEEAIQEFEINQMEVVQ